MLLSGNRAGNLAPNSLVLLFAVLTPQCTSAYKIIGFELSLSGASGSSGQQQAFCAAAVERLLRAGNNVSPGSAIDYIVRIWRWKAVYALLNLAT